MHDMNTQYQNQNSGHVNNNIPNGSSHSKPVIERGASWGFGETKILLALWGQDMVQRQLTNSKRTRHVWEKIAERIREHGYDRTADQVRTRVFNMIAEYRRILKNPTPERKKKCIFFDALHRIYQAKDSTGLENAILNYGEDHYNFDPIDFSVTDDNLELNGDDISDNDERSEFFAYTMSPSGFNSASNANNNDLNSNEDYTDKNCGLNDESTFHHNKRFRSENCHLNEAFSNFPIDSTASALLIDRMFAHLSKETEVMREWVNLERERLAQEVARRKDEKEREERREKSFLDVLTKLQQQVLGFITQNQGGSSSDQPITNTSSIITSSNATETNSQDK